MAATRFFGSCCLARGRAGDFRRIRNDDMLNYMVTDQSVITSKRRAEEMGNEVLHTTCCIVGGGPAGVMLGYLLARAGVQVTVLEKHRDFFRDFRGDTVHPSTLELLWQLDLLERFLQVPHQKVTAVGVQIGGEEFEVANFRRLSTHCRFALMMPQWDFLNFLAEQGRALPGFDLRMEHEAVGLTEEDGRVCGVRVRTPEGEREVRA